MTWEGAFGWVREDNIVEIEQALGEVQDEQRVRISLREGGYLLADG